MRLGGALGLFWTVYGYHAEGRQWTDHLLDQLDMVPTRYHAKLLITAGRIALQLNNLGAAQSYFNRALQLSHALGDTVNIAWALIYKGYTMMPDTGAALVVAEEGLALFQQLHHLPGIAQALNILGEVARFGGNDARAREAFEECLLVAQTIAGCSAHLLCVWWPHVSCPACRRVRAGKRTGRTRLTDRPEDEQQAGYRGQGRATCRSAGGDSGIYQSATDP